MVGSPSFLLKQPNKRGVPISGVARAIRRGLRHRAEEQAGEEARGKQLPMHEPHCTACSVVFRGGLGG